MQLLPLLSLAAAFLSSTIAAPAAPAAEAVHILEQRADAQCGSVYYTAAAVNAASVRACNNYNSGNTPGGYPHTFNNYEGFTFAVSGPYLEFPILSSGSLYTGGSPGADRVVINTSCKQAGTITHTGAGGNNFVMCT